MNNEQLVSTLGLNLFGIVMEYMSVIDVIEFSKLIQEVRGGSKLISKLKISQTNTKINLTNNELKSIGLLTDLTYLNLEKEGRYLKEGSKINDEGLISIFNLTNLRTLILNGINNYTTRGLGLLNRLSKLEYLDISNIDFLDGFGIQTISYYFTNLTALNITYQDIAHDEIELLLEIPHLNSLNISGCANIGNNVMMTLKDMTELKNLDIGNLPYIDNNGLQLLSNLTNLTNLNLYGNRQITDINFVRFLTNLESLGLEKTEVIDISPLYFLTKLKSLVLNTFGNKTDLSPIYNLTNLETINFGHTNLREYAPDIFNNLTKLRKLEIGEVGIDLKQIEYLTNLEDLDLFNSVYDDNINYLKNLTNLTKLDLSSNHFTNLDTLTNLTNLKIFDVPETKVDINLILSLTNLENLRLSVDTISVSDFKMLSSLTKLKELTIALRDIIDDDLLYLKNFPTLEILDLSQTNNITYIGIEYLAQLNKLRILKLRYLENMDISWIHILSQFPNLKELYIEASYSDTEYIKTLIGTEIFDIQIKTSFSIDIYKIYFMKPYLNHNII